MSEDKISVVLGKDTQYVTLPGGKQCQLKPLTFNDLAKAEDHFGVGVDEWESALKKIKNILYLITLALQKSQPELTVEQVGDLFTLENDTEIRDILSVLMKNSGLQQVEKNA